MPQAGDFSRYFIPRDFDSSLVRALYAELLGTFLFVWLSGLSSSALGAGLAYAVLVYATQSVSGGHLNPAITIAVTCSGLMHWVTAIAYIIAQVLGGIFGALLQVGLVPGLHIGHNHPTAPSCFMPASAIDNWQLFGWELLMTFAFVYVYYATQVHEQGAGAMGPLALGLVVYVAKEAGGAFTGASLNPVLVMGPAIIFHCTSRWWVYVVGELLGAVAAAVVSSSIFQFGQGRPTAYQQEGEDLRQRLVHSTEGNV